MLYTKKETIDQENVMSMNIYTYDNTALSV